MLGNWTVNQDQWLARHVERMLEQGDLYVAEEGGCRLTLQGEEKVLELLLLYTGQPDLLLLLEQFYAERFEVKGPFPQRSPVKAPGNPRTIILE